MSSIQILELYGVIIIVGLQFYLFIKTVKKIYVFKNIFPELENYSVSTIGLKKEFLDFTPNEIFSNLEELIDESIPKLIKAEYSDSNSRGILITVPAQYEVDERVYIDIITLKEKGNYVTHKIIYSLNIYLLKNRGVASDFHLIKDVAERNTGAVENEINQTISLPLYFGLLGTFLGIIVGLFQISGINFSSDPSALDVAIATLLNGVMIAMVASFTGLSLTIFNSGFLYKKAIVIIEDNKNDFYTFIQTDLLPVLNQGINSTFHSLQQNLHKFNDEFKVNVTKLSSVMGKNYDALIAQEKILTALDNIDIAEFAKANVKVLKELQVSTEKFGQFNEYLEQMNEMLTNSRNFAHKINEIIERTDNLNSVGTLIVETFERNKDLQLFLQSHYNSLDRSHQLISESVSKVNNTLDESLDKLKEFTQNKIIEVQKSVNKVNNTLDESLDKLKEFTQSKIIEVQTLVSKEMELLENNYPEKWQKLDNLTHLKSMNTNLNELKFSNASQIGTLTNEIKEINNNLNNASNQLEQIKLNGNNTISTKLTNFFSSRFKNKKQ